MAMKRIVPMLLLACTQTAAPPREAPSATATDASAGPVSPPEDGGLAAPATMNDAGPGDASRSDASSGRTAHCEKVAEKLALAPDHGRCDPAACTAAGGLCAYAGFCFGQACVKKSSDSGKTCTDSSQCESGCLARDGTPKGPATGRCAPGQITLGCHVWVSRGTVGGAALCGD